MLGGNATCIYYFLLLEAASEATEAALKPRHLHIPSCNKKRKEKRERKKKKKRKELKKKSEKSKKERRIIP